MASTKEDETAAAVQELGSMSLGTSAERKGEPEVNVNNNEDAEENNEAPAKLCSKCSKKSDALVKCRDCKCVWYCDKECQNKHWKEHKIECKPIKKALDKRGGKLDLGDELYLGPLPDLPPREECPICMRALPLDERLQVYSACCGKTLCSGCEFQHKVQTQKVNDKRAQKKQPPVPRACAFCREPTSKSDEEVLAMKRERVEHNDPFAMYNLGCKHGLGRLGLPVDQAKCIDLLRQSAGLGCAVAWYTLGIFHHTGDMGLEQNEEEAVKCWKQAAKGGDTNALHNLGCIAEGNGDFVAAMCNWRLAASGGDRLPMGALIECCFEKDLLHHAGLSETLRAMYRARAELKSDDRDAHIQYLKVTGKYDR